MSLACGVGHDRQLERVTGGMWSGHVYRRFSTAEVEGYYATVAAACAPRDVTDTDTEPDMLPGTVTEEDASSSASPRLWEFWDRELDYNKGDPRWPVARSNLLSWPTLHFCGKP